MLLRPASENQLNQRIVATLPANTSQAVYAFSGLCVRVQPNGAHYYATLSSTPAGVTGIYYIDASGTQAGLFTPSLIRPYDPTHTYSMDLQATGASPTKLTWTVTDQTAGGLVVSVTLAGLMNPDVQVAGQSGLKSASAPVTYSDVRTYKVANSSNVVFVGDSNTYGLYASLGQGTTAGTSFPALVVAALGKDWNGSNLGVSGKSALSMISDAPTQATQYLDASKKVNIAVVLAGTNDIGQSSVGGPVCAARVSSLCQIFRNAGFRVIVVTIPPATYGPADFLAERNAANAIIRATWYRYADDIADIASDPVSGYDDGDLWGQINAMANDL